jgi:predicted AAA+ superfamily ATPase
MLTRIMEDTLRRAIRTFPAVLVTGPRQSGKTTLLKMEWGRTHRFVALENPDVRARALADPVGFLRENHPPVILDEIQYVPELLPYIKTAIDENRSPGKWLLTGSQNFALMQGASESLAGRIAVVTLLPLSLSEASGKGGKPQAMATRLTEIWYGSLEMTAPRFSLGDWLLRGAYPEVRANPEVDRE